MLAGAVRTALKCSCLQVLYALLALSLRLSLRRTGKLRPAGLIPPIQLSFSIRPAELVQIVLIKPSARNPALCQILESIATTK